MRTPGHSGNHTDDYERLWNDAGMVVTERPKPPPPVDPTPARPPFSCFVTRETLVKEIYVGILIRDKVTTPTQLRELARYALICADTLADEVDAQSTLAAKEADAKDS